MKLTDNTRRGLKKNKKIIIAFALLVGVLGFGESVRAGIDVPFSTTFDCDCDPGTPGDQDWLQFSDTLSCDGVDKNLNKQSICGDWTHIETAANYYGGGGGKGLRNFVGDGKNGGSGTVMYTFNTPQTELWVRWYIRYESGFTWSWINGDKLLYFDMGMLADFQPKFRNFDDVYFRIYHGTGDTPTEGDGWDTMYAAGADDGAGHKRSDGSWHCMEIHVKMETVGNTDGIAQFWIDGVLQTNRTGIAFGDPGGGWHNFILYSNQEEPSNGGTCPYVDCDDLAISNTGYIGLINATDTTPPSLSNPFPNGTLEAGTTSTNLSLTTNINATCRYSTTPNTNYSLMQNTFQNTNSTNHSTPITGLEDDMSYSYYVRCNSTAGYVNDDDWNITFSIGGHKADLNDDGIITMPELMIFIGRWKAGDGVSKQEVEEARDIWFTGGVY